MRFDIRHRVRHGLAFCGLSCLLLAAAPWVEAETGPSIDDLGWLAGCWASEGGEEGSGEQWMEPAGGTMFGVSRTIQKGKTAFHEFMILREVQDGGLELVAFPLGQSETAFAMIALGKDKVTFENPHNDFPQRILYWLEEDGDLSARIEGEQGGETRGVDFAMTRRACVGPQGSGS